MQFGLTRRSPKGSYRSIRLYIALACIILGTAITLWELVTAELIW